ncbi:hypothetical protein Patl1_33318 [Pistacia atlantica]|uniref:Uncharacterized protein n=1 Tax=Pistacia atlantica TaxID=434234 RepID=A0ACC0ZS00_9ROSI|nr:hypothetical protein Patl1_33318 [Pistacia atlantica]
MSVSDLHREERWAERTTIWSVQDTHADDADVRELSVKPLLHIIEEIFQPASPSVPGFGQGTQVQLNVLEDDSAFQFDLNVMLHLLSSTINQISSKISSGGDEHETTMGILEILGSYKWDAKVVLALVAFAFNFGDFLVMAQPYSSNPLLKSVPLLKELPKTQERVDTFKPKIVELSNLIKAALNMTKCIVECIEFESLNAIYGEDIVSAVYWTIRCIVGCASQILGLTGMGRGYANPLSQAFSPYVSFIYLVSPNNQNFLLGCLRKISSIAETKFAQRVSSKHIYLKKRLNEIKERERSKEASEKFEKLMKEVHTDNLQVMKGLIYAKEDQLPLLKGDTEKRDSIEVLRSKNVLLLISDMKITDGELFILKKMYRESNNDPTKERSQYEVVWIPVVDRSTPWTHAKQDQFENCQLRMPWYSVYHPLMIDSTVITYIKKVWNFKENPILVVIDPEGKVINNNALHIIWIWGSLAFPFTSSKEAELWEHETWTFEFLAGFIDAAIPIWRAEDNYMCLYGGGDMDWIKKFTTTAQRVAEATRIKLQILYVGKSKPGEQIRENISIITVEKLSYSLQDLTLVWVFWERLKSMKQSRMQLKCAVQNDPVLQEINTILSFDEKDKGWALFCKGSDMAMARSEIILQCLTNFDSWRKYMNDQDFVIALNHYNRKFSLTQLIESQQSDNMDVLRALIYDKEDKLSLLKGYTKTRVSIEVLKSKTVLLLISDEEFENEKLFMLKKMYIESRQDPAKEESQYEVLWIPVVDRSTEWNETRQQRFENHQSNMTWYSVSHPLLIDPGVIIYIQEVRHFNKEPILVVLNPQGKLVNDNALHMLSIWGMHGFPFSMAKEAELWKQQNWRIKLLADSINEDNPNWIAEENYVCLYGGGNIDWIKKFIAKAQAVAEAAHIELQILYVGKSNPGDQIQGNISTITEEKLSRSLQDLPWVSFFWNQLKSMHQSRMHLGGTKENDPLMQEINTILSFDDKDEGWAAFCRGSDMAIAKREDILQCLSDFFLWRTYMNEKEFVTTLKHYHRKLLLVQLMGSPLKDSMDFLSALIPANKDHEPLRKADAKETASIEVLKNKTLLFLISDAEFVDEELLFMLKKMYEESRQFEMVWIPVVDRSNPWTPAQENQFLINRWKMSWYSVYHHSAIDLAVIMCIEQEWNFKKKPILVVLDPQGKLVNDNALHMLWIWGSLAFPFTSAREAELWKQQTWGIKLLADSINEAIPNWITEENYICLYGGGNIGWIKQFTAKAQAVSEAAHVKLQILYVGKSNPSEQIHGNISRITEEKLSHSLQDLPLVRFFWERLKIIFHSGMKLGFTLENDPIMQDINTILSFDNSDEGWAVFCRGSAMAMANGEIILQCLSDFDLWRTYMNDMDFVTALNHYRLVLLMELPHTDNLEILGALIYAKEVHLPLLKGDTKERASIEVLKSKTLLLLISDLEFANEELLMLEQSYKGSLQDPTKQYEIVWIPVVDRSSQWNKQGQFENHQSRMPWYSVYHPLMIKPGVLMYIEQVWKFKKKPIFVVLEPEGKVVNNNALHMLRIWGSLAFPFTSTREAELWTQEILRIELLADSIDATIPIWIQEENYICLYGGENMDWIREFTAIAHKVAEAASIPLQILYVGKSNSDEEQVCENIDTITVEKLSHSLQEYQQVWFFWQRLESMWHSKTQLGCTVENDPILQEINSLLSFDKNHEGWAVFCRGTAMAKAKGETILQCLKDFDSWKTHMEDKDFVTALNHHLNQLQKPTSMGETEHN